MKNGENFPNFCTNSVAETAQTPLSNKQIAFMVGILVLFDHKLPEGVWHKKSNFKMKKILVASIKTGELWLY